MKTCTVGCKLQNGLILESGYTVKHGNVVRLAEYKRVRIHGANQSRLVNDVVAAPQFFTAGITEGVDEDFFDKWCKDHQDSNIVRNKLIWKEASKADAQAHAIDTIQQRIGFEPLNQKTMGEVKPFVEE